MSTAPFFARNGDPPLNSRHPVRFSSGILRSSVPPNRVMYPRRPRSKVFMISYMVDGQGYLIISREVVSEDIEVRREARRSGLCTWVGQERRIASCGHGSLRHFPPLFQARAAFMVHGTSDSFLRRGGVGNPEDFETLCLLPSTLCDLVRGVTCYLLDFILT